MLVFRYDKSFDGLLSALFDAYAMRAFPEQLIGPGEPEPLFTERVHEVATDPAHAPVSGADWNAGLSSGRVRCSSTHGTGSRSGAIC